MISVVLPFRNAENTLENAIQSILNQTYPDFELILVDNASNDRSLKIAEKFTTKDKRIQTFRETRVGVSYASNLGFSKAKYPLIARMDADDISYPNRLLDQKTFLDRNPEIRIVGGKVKSLPRPESEGINYFIDWSNEIETASAIELNRFIELPLVNPTLMFRKSVYDKNGGYLHGDFPEDYELFLRYIENGVRFGKVDSTVLEWRDSPTRLTRTDSRYSPEAFARTKAKYLSKWLFKNVTIPIWVWGAGKIARRHSSYLEDKGVKIDGYIDVKERHIDKPCMHFESIPPPGSFFVLSYVSNRGKREEVREFLLNRGYLEGVDFLLVA